MKAAVKEEEEKKLFKKQVDVLATEAAVNSAKAKAKELAKKKREADKEAKIEEDAIKASQAASAARKAALIAKTEAGRELPTADEQKEAEVASVKKEAESIEEPAPKTPLEKAVVKKQKELHDTEKSVVDAKKLAAQDALAAKAAKVGQH